MFMKCKMKKIVLKTEAACSQRAAQQINGREGETATFLSRHPLNLSGLGGGFALRHLSRSAFRVALEVSCE